MYDLNIHVRLIQNYVPNLNYVQFHAFVLVIQDEINEHVRVYERESWNKMKKRFTSFEQKQE